ncbi:hypothetical protein THICB3510076 [Thiomonas sp. CB3]|nr:hypothetical protein THICB3510076 [Thiomonas sp. CB3]
MVEPGSVGLTFQTFPEHRKTLCFSWYYGVAVVSDVSDASIELMTVSSKLMTILWTENFVEHSDGKGEPYRAGGAQAVQGGRPAPGGAQSLPARAWRFGPLDVPLHTRRQGA